MPTTSLSGNSAAARDSQVGFVRDIPKAASLSYSLSAPDILHCYAHSGRRWNTNPVSVARLECSPSRRPTATLVGMLLEAGFNVALGRRRRRHGHCSRDACKRAKVCTQIICLLQGISYPMRDIVFYLPLAFLSFSCAHKRLARTTSRLSASFFETTTAYFGLRMTLEGQPFCNDQLSSCIAVPLVIAQDGGSAPTS